MPSPADQLLRVLEQTGLLDPTAAAAVRRWADERNADQAAAVKELLNRGIVTAFQAREIASGRTRDLTVGPYLLLDVIGEGGMGRVYKARHARLGRVVALKVIRKDKLSNPQVVSRFQQEVHAAAQVSHPNVVMAFDAETADDKLFLSMEFVEGTDLTKLVRQNGPMPIPHACDAVRQAALGLQHAHEMGLVHRDIKPSNLLYTPRGQVKVLDLGLALLHQAAAADEKAHRVTQQGYVLGTPDFLAPEQAQNPTAVDIRADVYALGATLFYLLTARVPFDGATLTDKLIKHVTEPPPNLLAFRPEAPPQLAAVIQWLMAKRPQDRPQSPAQVAAALAPFGLPPASFAVPAASPRPHQPEELQPVFDDETVPTQLPAFADLDAEDERSRRDARPRRREARGTKPRKRSGLPLMLIGLGVAGVVCAGGCIGAGFFIYQWAESAKPLDAEFTTDVGGVKLVSVNAGTFDMGSPDGETGRQPDEGPVRSVKLSSGFYMGTTEVTRQQYFDVTGEWPKLSFPQVSNKFLPRVPATVSWRDANTFARKLTEREKGRRFGWEFRLPTEAEWEYAARGGGKGGPFGGKSRLVQYRDGIFKLGVDDTYGESNPTPPLDKESTYTFVDKPCGIGAASGDADYLFRREPNELGLFDMAGNVWELCHDRYDNYPDAATATDPTGPAAGNQRVARGGAFDTTATNCRAAARRFVEPNQAERSVGFRIVYGPKVSER